MRIALLTLVTLTALTATARAADVGYADLQRAVNECADGKKAVAELQADEQARMKAEKDFDAASAARAKDKAKPAPAAIPTREQWAQQIQAKQAEKTGPIVVRMRRILASIAKARKLTAIAPAQSMVFVSPSLDLTEELVRRYDAGDGVDQPLASDEAKRLRDENAALKAKLAKRDPAAPKYDAATGVRLPNLDPRALTATRPTP